MLLLALLLAAAPSPRKPAGPGKAKLSAGSADQPGAGPAKRVGMLLKMGRFVQAEANLALVAEPSALQSFQHSQALVGMGRCTQGEALLPKLTPQQRALLSPRLAACYAHHQQWHRAAEWLEEAQGQSASLNGGQAALLWLSLARAGEAAELTEAVELTEALQTDSGALQLSVATRALDLGDVDGVDDALALLPPEDLNKTGVHLLNAQLELDLGNVAAAEAHAKSALEGARDDVRAIALLAEIRRRSGWSFGAAMTLKRKPLLVPHHPRLRAVAVRIAVDQGELEQAQALLDAGLDEGFVDAELYASAWYLHAHLQDGQAELWAQRWALVNTSTLRSLEQL